VSDAFVAVLVIDLHFPEAGSLKSKRKELSSLKAALRQRLGAAVAEIGHQDSWQRTTLSAVVTGGTLAQLDAAASRIERWLDAHYPQGAAVERLTASLEDLRG
jgi:uncharacterized protein YlxP (DUF503 family)